MEYGPYKQQITKVLVTAQMVIHPHRRKDQHEVEEIFQKSIFMIGKTEVLSALC